VKISILAVIALAGAIAGWITAPFGGRGESPAPGGESSVRSPATGTGVPEVESESGKSPTPTEDTVSNANGDDASTLRQEFTALLARLPAFEVAAGDGVIEGSVVRHADGAPLAGIAIDWIQWGSPPASGAEGLSQPELSAYLLEKVEWYRFKLATTHRAVTDAHGRFRISGLLRDEEYVLYPLPNEDWLILSGGEGSVASPGDTVELRAAPFAIVEVEVLDERGAPVESGLIRIGSPEGEETSWGFAAFYSKDREVRAPLGRCRLSTTSSGGEFAEALLEITDRERRTVRLNLLSEPFLEVRVLAAEPFDRFDLRIHLLPLDGTPLPDEPWESVDDERARHDDVDYQTGKWRASIEPGRYLLRLLRYGTVLHEETLILGEARRTLEITASPVPSERVAFVRVLGPDGEPAPNVSFDLHARTVSTLGGANGHPEEEEIFLGVGWHDLGSGRYAIVSSPLPRTEPGTEVRPFELFLEVESEPHGELEIPLELGVSRVQEIRFPESIDVVIDLVGYVGHELQGQLEIELRGAEAGSSLRSGGTIDELGRATFRGIHPGRWIVKLLAGERHQRKPALEREIEVSSTARAFAIPLPELYSVRVRCPGCEPGHRLFLRSAEGDFARSAQVGDEGIAEFSDLVPGEYRLTSRTGNESQPVRVPGEAEIRFEPLLSNALDVVISANEGWLARSGFLDGDHVVGVTPGADAEGDEIPDLGQLRLAVLRAIAAGKGAIVVERGGETLRIPIPSGPPPSPAALGGWFEPVHRGKTP